MSAATFDFADIDRSEDDGLLKAFLALETPEGFKAELIEGEIVVTPPPDGDHETVISRIARQIHRLASEEMDFAGTKGLIVPTGHLIPDGTVTRAGALLGRESWSKPEGVLMVLEVTSRHPHKDREQKRRGYAAAEIPLYLLVDRQRDRLVLHSEPLRGDYNVTAIAALGDPLTLPHPFGFDLDTTKLY
jgi:Uma2 family endonuclease